MTFAPFALAVISGFLSAMALPSSFGGWRPPDLGWLAWIAWVPLLLALGRDGASLGRAWRLGLVSGFVHFAGTLYWIFIALHRYGDVPVWGAVAAVVLGSLLMSLFPAAACWLSALLARRWPWTVAFPFAWTTVEYARNFLPFGGFPWSNLAYSQSGFLTLIQVVDMTGVYGLVFLIALGNAVAAGWLRTGRKTHFAPTLVFAVLLIESLVYGYVRQASVRIAFSGAKTMPIAVVQGNIPQEEKWLEEKIEEIIARHVDWTLKAEAGHPRLVIWPEAAFPAVLPPELTKIAELKALKTDLLMGVVRYDGFLGEEWPPKEGDNFRLFNSAVLLGPEGAIEDRYDKVHLVPVGEYVPFSGWMPFFRQIVEAMGTFTPGDGFHLMGVDGKKFGVTICYEDLFPEISRSLMSAGADFLVNLTNDGWYDRSSAIFQHFDFSRFRAVETRLALVRSTNTGVTGVFAPTGEVLASLPPFQQGILEVQVPLKPARWKPSLYARFGDVFAWGCVLVAALLGVFAVTTKERPQ